MVLIEVSSLEKNFGNLKVLKNINLKINKGEIFGIVGHSGVGKSTLLRCLNKLEGYDKGTIKIEDKEINNLEGKELREFRKNLGMIFQNFSLLERKTVFENIALPMECWGFDKKYIKSKVLDLLKVVNLEDKINSKPKELSGGQKQRVAIARALALDPHVLLCDEATSALDPKTTKDILKLLREINERLNITIIIVTHQMEVIREICNRVAIMESGEIVEMGDVEELFLKPPKALKRLIGEEDIIPDTGVNIKIFFPKDASNESIITSMARELDIDISIVWGKLERFRDDVLGSLVINVNNSNEKKVIEYLSNKDISWEVVNNE